MFPPPGADENFQTQLKISSDKDAWEIPEAHIQKDDELGRGNFGIVYKGKHNGTVVAIKELKEVDKDKQTEDYKKEAEDFKKENEVMRKLNHPSLVKMHGIVMNPNMLIMEFCEKGSIKDYLEKFRFGKNSTQIRKDDPDCPKFEDLREWCEQIAKGIFLKLNIC